MAPPSQELEPPANPERFTPIIKTESTGTSNGALLSFSRRHCRLEQWDISTGSSLRTAAVRRSFVRLSRAQWELDHSLGLSFRAHRLTRILISRLIGMLIRRTGRRV